MKKTRTTARLLTMAALCLAPFAPSAAGGERAVRIGTAAATGVYHAVGRGVCALVNRDEKRHGILCEARGSNGTVDNLGAVRAGRVEFGVAQSDWQRNAYYGEDRFKSFGRFKDLRTVMAAHAEPFTLLAHPRAGVHSFEDLRGKRVNVGVPGSGRRATMEALMRVFGLRMDDFALAAEIKNGRDIAAALCDGTVDAAVYSIGHPNEEVAAATDQCGAALVDIAGAPLERMLAAHPHYRRAVIAGGMYRGNPRDTKTFGSVATLVTSADTPDEVVYEMLHSVFIRLDEFRDMHPAFADLRARDMASFEGGAPMHAGAARFFAEMGY